MIGKLILLGVLIVNIVFTWISVSYSIAHKVALGQALIPVALSLALGIGLLFVYLGI